MTEYTPIVICPFFVRIKSGGTRLVCEGVTDGGQCQIGFATKEDLRAYMDNFCTSFDYHRCHISQAAAEKFYTKKPQR